MSHLFSSADVVGMALEHIGEKSLYDKTARADATAIGLKHLDALIAELTGANLFLHMRGDSQTVPLQANVEAYDLTKLIPNRAVQFVMSAWLDPDNRPCKLLLQEEYERAKATPGDAAQAQPSYTMTNPYGIWIDTTTMVMHVRPVPVQANGQGIRLITQITAADLTGTANSVPHGFPAAYQRGLAYLLASDIGDGPVAKKAAEDIARWEARGRKSLVDVMALLGRQQVDLPRCVAYRDF